MPNKSNVVFYKSSGSGNLGLPFFAVFPYLVSNSI